MQARYTEPKFEMTDNRINIFEVVVFGISPEKERKFI